MEAEFGQSSLPSPVKLKNSKDPYIQDGSNSWYPSVEAL